MYSCPRCGGVLRLRTAKRGAKAGKQFYACANWRPGGGGCNFTQDKSEWEQQQPNHPETASATPRTPPDVSRNPHAPVALQARAKFKTHRVKFLQPLALPRAVLATVQAEGDAARPQWEQYSTWRVDVPTLGLCQMEQAARCVLHVAMKILTRGRLTVVSPFLEAALAEVLRADWNAPRAEVVPHYNDFFPRVAKADIWFDGSSGTEEHFYWHLLPGLL